MLEKWLFTDIGVESYICSECSTAWLAYANIGVTRAGSPDLILDWLGYEPIDRHKGGMFLEAAEWPEQRP